MKKLSAIVIMVLFAMILGCKKQPQLESLMIRSSNIGCSHCEENIKKAIFTLEGVKEVNVDTESKTVEVMFVPLQTNIETIEITLTRAGYDANERSRDPEGYANLDDCCKH